MLKFVLILLLVGGFSFASLHLGSAFAVTESNVFKCETLYDVYKKIGEKRFEQKYYKNKAKDCLQLYKDPNWTFAGKEKIDRQEQIIKSIQESASTPPKIVMAKPKYLGDSKYSIHFAMCANTRISDPNILVKTGIEEFIIMSTQPIDEHTCKLFNTKVNALYQNNISLTYIPSEKDPIFKTTKIVVFDR